MATPGPNAAKCVNHVPGLMCKGCVWTVPGRKRHTAEQVIGKLRTAEIELAKGLGTAEVVRKLGITEQTYYRWRKEYGGLRLDQTWLEKFAEEA